jgi:thiamine pyrophosphokinase
MGVGSCDGALKNICMKTKNLSVAIVAGVPVAKKFLPAIRRSTVVIGVDRGALFLLRNKIVPDVALGDFDSVTAQEKARIKRSVKRFVFYPRKKDATDLELAVSYASALRPAEVVIYGALGGRFDHAIAATHLLLELHARGIVGSILDAQNEVRVVTGVHRVEIKKEYRYVSVLSMTKTAIVTLRGFAYEVRHTILRRGSTTGISNEVRKKSATVDVHKGKVLMIRSWD